MTAYSFLCHASSLFTLVFAAALLPQLANATFGHAGDCHFDVSCNGTVERSVDGDLAPGNHIEITTGNCPIFKSSLGLPITSPRSARLSIAADSASASRLAIASRRVARECGRRCASREDRADRQAGRRARVVRATNQNTI